MVQESSDLQEHSGVQEKIDILIIGAGLSGVGAAVHFSKQCPGKSIALLESRANMGGTWDLFRYPGIRSDSDMFTLGYGFKPWLHSQGIADGNLIRDYINEAAEEYGVAEKVQFNKRATKATWNSRDSQWTVDVTDQNSGAIKQIKAGFVMACTGYYNYASGYEPDFPGKEDFQGKLIHPQFWPEDYDYSDKKVVIIGSGATAVTLAPAMAPKASHVTVLQRSPSYVMNMPKVDQSLEKLRARFSPKLYYRLARAQRIGLSFFFYRFCKWFPDKARDFLQRHVAEAIGPEQDMTHFTPKYQPWDERVCAVTDGDLFKEVRDGGVTMVTDHIERFTAGGILLKSGKLLEADVIVSATGLELQLLGGMPIEVDGEDFKMPEKLCYRGVLMEDLPNMGFVFGYTNASWTLKADLVMRYVCRVINKMDRDNVASVVPRNTGGDPGGVPFLDLQSGYVKRAADKMPQQGRSFPWRLYQNFMLDFLMLRFGRLDDGKLTFRQRSQPVEASEPVLAEISSVSGRSTS